MRKIWILFWGYLVLLFLLFLPHIFDRTDKNTIVIGSKNNTEDRILSEMLSILIEKNTDLHVEKKFYLEGTFIAFKALITQSIDLYIDYTGTLLVSVLKEKNTKKSFKTVKEELLKKHSIVVLDPFGFDNSYSLIIRSQMAKEKNIYTISDLVPLKNIRAGFDPEFSIRPEFFDLKKCYDLSFASQKILDQSLLYLALTHGSIDVMNGDSTDGRILKYDLVFLKDDRECFPIYDAVPIIRSDVLQAHPSLKKTIDLLANRISIDRMREMNLLVENGAHFQVVAIQFLKELHLL